MNAALARGAVIAALLLSSEAATSERQRNVTLEQVVAHSDLIIVARPATPATREVSRSVEGAVAAPPFEYVLQRWIVDEVLLGPDDAPKAGAVLEVEPADLDYDFGIHVARHVRGVDKIALREVYAPKTKRAAEGSGPRLLFLMQGEKGFRFTYRGATEALSMKAKVERLVRAKNRGGEEPQ